MAVEERAELMFFSVASFPVETVINLSHPAIVRSKEQQEHRTFIHFRCSFGLQAPADGARALT